MPWKIKSLVGNVHVKKQEDNSGVITWTTNCDNSLLNSSRGKNGKELIVVTEAYKLMDVCSITPQNRVYFIFFFV